MSEQQPFRLPTASMRAATAKRRSALMQRGPIARRREKLKGIYLTHTWDEAAEHLGCHRQTVKNDAAALGIECLATPRLPTPPPRKSRDRESVAGVAKLMGGWKPTP